VLERVAAQRRADLAVAEAERAQVLDAVDARSRPQIGAEEFTAGEQRAQIVRLARFDLERAELDDRLG
jgi:hypothetical protein